MGEELSILDAITAQTAYPAAKRMFAGPNTLEGPTAFSEKRAPNWSAPKPLAEFSKGSRL